MRPAQKRKKVEDTPNRAKLSSEEIEIARIRQEQERKLVERKENLLFYQDNVKGRELSLPSKVRRVDSRAHSLKNREPNVSSHRTSCAASILHPLAREKRPCVTPRLTRCSPFKLSCDERMRKKAEMRQEEDAGS